MFYDLIIAASLPIQLVEWIHTWLNINVSIRKCQFAEAISNLETLRTTSMFGNNELVSVMLGQCYYYNGDYDIALTHLHRAHAHNFYILEGLSELNCIFFYKPIKKGFCANEHIYSEQVYWVQFMQKEATQPNWKS